MFEAAKRESPGKYGRSFQYARLCFFVEIQLSKLEMNFRLVKILLYFITLFPMLDYFHFGIHFVTNLQIIKQES